MILMKIAIDKSIDIHPKENAKQSNGSGLSAQYGNGFRWFLLLRTKN
jgi:hypothetical protein